MRILAIMGTLRKKNNYQLIQQIEQTLKQFGDIEFEYLFLKDLNFQHCRGCFNCIAKGKQFCPLKDDRDMIEAKILAADGVILNSPGYAWNVTWIMKNFIDRFAFTMHRPIFFSQKLLLVVGGGSGIDKALDSLSFTLGGSHLISKLGIMTNLFTPVPKYQKKIARKIQKTCNKFYNAILTQKQIKINVGLLIYFNMFKDMALKAKEQLPADYEYYIDKNYFYPAKISSVKNGMAKIVSKLALRFMKSMFVEFQ